MLVYLVESWSVADTAATLCTPFAAAGDTRSHVSGNCGLNPRVRLVDNLSVADQSATLRTPFQAAGYMHSRVAGHCGLNHARAFG